MNKNLKLSILDTDISYIVIGRFCHLYFLSDDWSYFFLARIVQKIKNW